MGFLVDSPRSEVRGPKSKVWGLEARDLGLSSSVWKLGTGDRRLETGFLSSVKLAFGLPSSVFRLRSPTFYLLPPASWSRGFTLLEVLVALAVLAVALVSLVGLHNRNVLLALRTERLSTGTLLAQEILTRTQLEGVAAGRITSGDFAELHPGRYPEFRWHRTVRPTPLDGLWEVRVGVSWGEREDETCELTLFSPLEGS